MIDRYSVPPMSDLWSEEAKFQVWLEVEIAACEAHAAAGRMPAEDVETIRERAVIDVARIEEIEATVHHDVIAFTTQLAEKIGPASRFVHMGLTSSDVVDTAQGLRIKRAGAIILEDLDRAIAAAENLATEHAMTPMMGRTHGMHAEPTTFGLKALTWHQELLRARVRVESAIAEAAVGKISGAVGTCAHYGVEYERAVCERLGINVDKASTQVVGRDRHAAFLNALALVGAAMERIATEIRHLQRPEMRELEEPFAKGQKGSSAMPHKRNPIVCERLTGLARILRANALAGMENVALWGERDISHSSVERVILPDSCLAADYGLRKLSFVLEGLLVNKARMAANLNVTRGLIFSQKVLLRLVESGVSREDAYAAVQAAAMRTWHDGDPFLDELLKEEAVSGRFSRTQLSDWFTIDEYLIEIPAIFARCGLTV
ncbi:MAG: adenylosuccinate lyase [Sumerlaeia bacterium]